ASIEKEDCEPDPDIWYIKKFDDEPDYSKILGQLVHSSTERSQMLKDYFEPSDDELEDGIKTPTDAHKAIAELVKGGYIRVIITTNFDRLLEKALESVNIHPTVISTEDSAKGAIPLQHSQCTIVKVNGDYLDTRIKNTRDELSEYGEQINTLLDRIFDDFGLIVCGWSAEWDVALYKTIERCKNHRFTTYWTTRGNVNTKLDTLINLRRAMTISIHDADTFFAKMSENILAIDELNKPHPLSAKLAVATLKKYLVDDRHRIRLHDFVMQEVENLYGELSDEHFPSKREEMPNRKEELNHRLKRYESLVEIVQSMMIYGCYWGDESQEKVWMKCLERIANPSGKTDGVVAWINLRLYPALLLLYGGGIASIAAEKYDTFSTLLTKRSVEGNDPIVLNLYIYSVFADGASEYISRYENSPTPVSSYLFEILREPLREILPQDVDYQKCFERFEYLLGLIYVDLKEKNDRGYYRGPVGNFWRKNIYDSANSIMSKVEH
ncbi:MAG: SIR2 family protein, partial [Candidatus Heimdallarchaeota archaeon]|nr:SIR2 family protein [Candidatus Heimdallarchaeota archaeon]